jgi:hypothetical protein
MSAINFKNLLNTTIEHDQQARLQGEKYCLMAVLKDLTDDIPIKNIPVEALEPMYQMIKRYGKRLEIIETQLKF